MATKRQRLKLKRLSKIDFEENTEKSNLPDEDCFVIEDIEINLQQDGKDRVETSKTITDKTIMELRKSLEMVGQTFQSSSFIPFPSLEVNNLNNLSSNEIGIDHFPQWRAFPAACNDCAIHPILSLKDDEDSSPFDSVHDSPSPKAFSLIPSTSQTNENLEDWNEKPFPSPEARSLSEMKTCETSPDLFGHFSSESRKPKLRTFQDLRSVSKNLFFETNKETKDSSGNIANRIRSCPLCQESFPSQMSQLDIDEHIACCLTAAADDEDDDVGDDDVVW